MTLAPPLTETATLIVRRGVTAREFDGEWIILDLNGGSYYGLDRVGGDVWTNLCAGRSLGETAAIVSAGYGVDVAVVLSDVLRLAHDLVEQKLLVVADGAAP